jgi:hypothetical protein
MPGLPMIWPEPIAARRNAQERTGFSRSSQSAREEQRCEDAIRCKIPTGPDRDFHILGWKKAANKSTFLHFLRSLGMAAREMAQSWASQSLSSPPYPKETTPKSALDFGDGRRGKILSPSRSEAEGISRQVGR